MGYVDFILNLAGLLLWLNWRSIRFDPLEKRTPATLMGTLRPAAPKKIRRWHFLVFIAGLLLLRAVVYCWMTPLWVGNLDLGVTALQFRSNSFSRILLFSFLSFVLTLGIFYVALLFMSLLKGPDPIHRLVKIPLGRVDGWPVWAKVLLPLAGGMAFWLSLFRLLSWLQVCPPTISVAQRIEQSVLIGLSSYLVWKFLIGLLLLLHLLSSYIYFGKHPVWSYVTVTAQKILRPLNGIPLRVKRVDFSPVVGIALVFLAAYLVENGVPLFGKMTIPGLIGLYSKLPL
jgi:uncharacterized protein YggT (Ycf19 family)